jgi:predicted enzyme related to lactoylglutathione lyase
VLSAPNVDEAFEQVQKSGGDVVQEPIDQPYGLRDCAFRDPAGNMVRINQQP